MIYFVQRRNGDIKIGYTAANVTRRKATLELAHDQLVLLGEIDGTLDTEKGLHWRFRESRIDKREWFKPTNDLLDYIKTETRQHKKVEVKRVILPEIPLPEDPSEIKVVNRFNEYVQATGVTLADVSDATGLSMFTLSRMKRGHITRYEYGTMSKLCKFFKCRLGEMLA